MQSNELLLWIGHKRATILVMITLHLQRIQNKIRLNKNRDTLRVSIRGRETANISG